MTKKVSLDAVKTLREKTGAPINACRVALESSGGDERKALESLKQQGVVMAEKRQGRATAQGRVESYVHHDGRLAALVEVNCETDFVARTTDFVQFCKDVAMHVAWAGPRYVRREDATGDGGLSAEDLKALCLLEQPFVRDQSMSVGDLLKVLITKTGENVVVRRMARFAVGEAAGV